MTDYMPHLFTNTGDKWDVLEMHFCIDFGGRQVQIEAQNTGTYVTKAFVYYYMDDSFMQWDSSEHVDAQPLNGKLTDVLKHMFEVFEVKG